MLIMKTYINQEIEKIIINESLINGISWSNEFKDVIIDLDWAGQDDLKEEFDFLKIKTSLYFEFVTEMESKLKFQPKTMGALEIGSFSFALKDKIWLIEFRFDFYSIGYIKFNCNNLKFIIENIAD
jgi:hypothetical protein